MITGFLSRGEPFGGAEPGAWSSVRRDELAVAGQG